MHTISDGTDAARIAQDTPVAARPLLFARGRNAVFPFRPPGPRAFGTLRSSSAMRRWLPAIDAVASQMGQQIANSPEISERACPAWDNDDPGALS